MGAVPCGDGFPAFCRKVSQNLDNKKENSRAGNQFVLNLSQFQYRVSTGTGWPGVSILWLGEIKSLICNFCLSVVALTIELIRPWDTLARCWDVSSFVTVNVCWLVGCLTSQQQASVSQGRICSDNFVCCHTEIEVADPTFYLPQSQYTDTGPTSPSADPITPGAWQSSHWSANFEVTGMTRPRKNPGGIRTRDLPLSRRTP